jgi:hypothetical protein
LNFKIRNNEDEKFNKNLNDIKKNIAKKYGKVEETVKPTIALKPQY